MTKELYLRENLVMKLNKKHLFFPALSLGVVAIVVSANLNKELPLKPSIDNAKLVITSEIELTPIAPLAVGFGHISPKVEWAAIAEVSGRVVYKHPDLEKGKVLAGGTEVIRIDPLDYELKLAQAKADLRSSKNSLSKVLLNEKNLKKTLEIESSRLALSKSETDRKIKLREKGLVSQSDLDNQTLSLLSQEKMVLDIANQLSLTPDEIHVAESQVNIAQSKVIEAERQLERTVVMLPYEIRVADVDVEEGQVANLQQAMISGHGTDMMEVTAQLPLHEMHTLLNSLDGNKQLSDLQAHIRLDSGEMTTKWEATVSGLSESIDTAQGTVGVILDVKPVDDALLPLSNGMFVSAVIEGVESPAVVVTEDLLHEGNVYLMAEDGTLDIEPVETLFRRGNNVAIKLDESVKGNLVVSDVLPALQGMKLKASESGGDA